MLLWIAIYSFFYSFDFIDEVVVLFGGVTFWAVVFISVVVALGTRFGTQTVSALLTTFLQLPVSFTSSWLKSISRSIRISYAKRGSWATSRIN